MTHYESAYVTLNEVVTQLDMTDEALFDSNTSASIRIDTQDINTSTQLKRFIYEVSDDLHNTWWRDFIPYVDTLTLYANQYDWYKAWSIQDGGYVFDLSRLFNRDLLIIDSITLNGTSISSSNYRLDLSDGYPAQKIIFDADNITFPTSPSWDTAIVIAGTWGYHDNPSNMWRSSGDTVQDDPLSDSATSLTVSSGANFEVYQYLKIEDEYLFVTSIASNTLTVERGVNGTVAASHVQDTAINTYRQVSSVRKEVRRMVARAWHLRNGVNVVTNNEAIRDIMEGSFILSIPRRDLIGSV